MNTRQTLWKLIRFQPWLILLISLFWIVIQGLPLIGGWVLREVFDTLSNNGPAVLNVWTLLGLFVLAAIGREIGRFIVFSQEPMVTNRTSALLSHNLLNHILAQPGAKAIDGAPGEIVSRFRGDAQAIAVFLIWAPTNVGRLFFTVVAIGVMVQINLLITVGVLVPIILISTIIRATRSRIETYRRISREAAGAVSETIGEIFGATQAIKVANAEGGVIGHFRQVNEHRRRVALRDRLLNEVQNSLFGGTVEISTGVILLLAAQSMQEGAFTIGDFSLFVFYLSIIGDYVGMFGVFFARLKQLEVSLMRVGALFKVDTIAAQMSALVQYHPINLKAPLTNQLTTINKIDVPLTQLQVKGLTYRYSSTKKGITDINFTCSQGSFTVITGQVGSGKTTLLRTILGLLPKDSGAIYWNEQAVANPTQFFKPPRSGYTPQVPRLFSDSLRNNILLGLSEDEVNLDQALHVAVLEDDVAGMATGLDTPIGPRGVRLSGGQLQRTAVARMMVRQAGLIVCDDVSSALDVETERQLWERIFSQRQTTCLVVSHRRAVLERADQIIVLQAGSVAGCGTLTDLLANCAEMKQLWNQNYQAERN